MLQTLSRFLARKLCRYLMPTLEAEAKRRADAEAEMNRLRAVLIQAEKTNDSLTAALQLEKAISHRWQEAVADYQRRFWTRCAEIVLLERDRDEWRERAMCRTNGFAGVN